MSIQFASQWSALHIASCLAAFAAFAAASGACVGYVLQGWMLRSKRINALQRILPALTRVDLVSYKLAAFGFMMLTVGLMSGMLRSQSVNGTFWAWNPKQAWTLVSWIVYAAYLHVRIASGWRGRWTNWLLLTGFACLFAAVLRKC